MSTSALRSDLVWTIATEASLVEAEDPNIQRKVFLGEENNALGPAILASDFDANRHHGY